MIFFFKQKTAYEMRISDWSSDVCSSDLLMTDSEFDVVMPVAPFTYPIGRSLSINIDGRIELNFPENLNVRSQDLPPAFHDAGQWYWFYVDAFMRERVLMGRNTGRSEEHTSELQSLMRISYAVFCLKKKNNKKKQPICEKVSI